MNNPFPQLDPVDPGWDFDELVDLDPSEYPADGLFTAITAIGQAEAMLYAKKLQVLAALADTKADDLDAEWLADTLAASNRTSIARARSELDLARTRSARLPETLRLLAAGRLDVPRVRQLHDLTNCLTDDDCAELEQRLYPTATEKTPRQFTVLVNRTIAAIDPEAAQTRAVQAKRTRRVETEPAGDGMAWLSGFLPAEDARAAYTRIDTLARGLNTKTEARTMDQLRADVLRDLILGTDTPGGGVATTVYVTVTAETLLGFSDLPGELRGYGPLPAERIRELAYTLQAQWTGVLVDGDGHPQAMSPNAYRFRGKLAEYVRLRDNTCTHPACNQPADKCDIDHVIPWPRGETTPENASSECRRHHREKHEAGWTIHREDKSTIWTSPTGIQHHNTPTPMPVGANDPPPF